MTEKIVRLCGEPIEYEKKRNENERQIRRSKTKTKTQKSTPNFLILLSSLALARLHHQSSNQIQRSAALPCNLNHRHIWHIVHTYIHTFDLISNLKMFIFAYIQLLFIEAIRFNNYYGIFKFDMQFDSNVFQSFTEDIHLMDTLYMFHRPKWKMKANSCESNSAWKGKENKSETIVIDLWKWNQTITYKKQRDCE